MSYLIMKNMNSIDSSYNKNKKTSKKRLKKSIRFFFIKIIVITIGIIFSLIIIEFFLNFLIYSDIYTDSNVDSNEISKNNYNENKIMNFEDNRTYTIVALGESMSFDPSGEDWPRLVGRKLNENTNVINNKSSNSIKYDYYQVENFARPGANSVSLLFSLEDYINKNNDIDAITTIMGGNDDIFSLDFKRKNELVGNNNSYYDFKIVKLFNWVKYSFINEISIIKANYYVLKENNNRFCNDYSCYESISLKYCRVGSFEKSDDVFKLAYSKEIKKNNLSNFDLINSDLMSRFSKISYCYLKYNRSKEDVLKFYDVYGLDASYFSDKIIYNQTNSFYTNNNLSDFSIFENTRLNYLRLYNISKSLDLDLYISFYPNRKIDVIKSFFKEYENDSYYKEHVFLIENYDNFENAIKKRGYYYYFQDIDGIKTQIGGFNSMGHLTYEGHNLIANAVYETILSNLINET
jgi:hypothetical protein